MYCLDCSRDFKSLSLWERHIKNVHTEKDVWQELHENSTWRPVGRGTPSVVPGLASEAQQAPPALPEPDEQEDATEESDLAADE